MSNAGRLGLKVSLLALPGSENLYPRAEKSGTRGDISSPALDSVYGDEDKDDRPGEESHCGEYEYGESIISDPYLALE